MTHPREAEIQSPNDELLRLAKIAEKWAIERIENDYRNFHRLNNYYQRRDELRTPAMLQEQAS